MPRLLKETGKDLFAVAKNKHVPAKPLGPEFAQVYVRAHGWTTKKTVGVCCDYWNMREVWARKRSTVETETPDGSGSRKLAPRRQVWCLWCK